MEQYLTTMEAASIAGVQRSVILYWIKRGYLGEEVKNQAVTRGSGCGYRIPSQSLNRYISGIRTEPEMIKPAPKPTKRDFLAELKAAQVDKESMRIALNNLKIAVAFCQEEIDKIEALLK